MASSIHQSLLLGADTVQVCTGVMIHGYPLVQNLCAELQEFMGKHEFQHVSEFKGKCLDKFTTHSDLVGGVLRTSTRIGAYTCPLLSST